MVVATAATAVIAVVMAAVAEVVATAATAVQAATEAVAAVGFLEMAVMVQIRHPPMAILVLTAVVVEAPPIRVMQAASVAADALLSHIRRIERGL